MVTLYALMHSAWWIPFIGLCALAVIFALIRNINQQEPDVLPAPRMDRIARGGHDAWTLSEPRIINTGNNK